MVGFAQKFRSKVVLRIATLATAGIAVSGCTYDVGLGYASDGYRYGGGSGYYVCDPYSPFDSYYDCDNGYGYSNIGYGGGWYDNLWYPGYGFNLFDNNGQRYNMRDSHRRYWGERRHRWYRENRGRHDGGRYDIRGYTNSATPDTIDRAERNGGRVRDGDNYRNRSGERLPQRRDELRGGNNSGVDAGPVTNTESVQGDGKVYGRPQRGGEGVGYRQSPLQSSIQSEAPVTRFKPVSRGGRAQEARGFRNTEGAVGLPQ